MGKKIITSAALLLLTSTAIAGEGQTGTVKNIVERTSDGAVLVYLDGALNTKTSCSGGKYWVIKDEKSRSGKKQREALVKALADKRDVTFIGLGTCSRVSDGEDIDSIIVANLSKDEIRDLGGPIPHPAPPDK